MERHQTVALGGDAHIHLLVDLAQSVVVVVMVEPCGAAGIGHGARTDIAVVRRLGVGRL